MPLDPRIALMGTQWQAPDFQGALAKGQEYRTNQMAQQAAQATAALNRNAMNDAALLDPNDRGAQQQYALRYGAAATPFLTALSSVDTNFAGRGTERRAEGKFNTEQQAAASDALSEAIGLTVQDPSDTRIAGARAAFVATGGDGAAFDAYVAPILAVDYASGARQPMVVNMIGGSPEGERLVDRFTGKYERTNMGDRSIVDQTNPYAPGFTPPVEQQYGESPNRKQLVPLADGTFAVVDLGTGQGTTATSPSGTPLVGRAPGAEGQITAQRRGQLQGQINTVNNDVIPALDRMDALLTTGDVITGAGAELRLQAARGLAFAGNRDAQRQVAATQEYQNLAKSLAAGMAKTLGSNPSNADIALLTQVTGGMIGQETPALQATSAALRSRASGLVVDAQDMLGIEAAPAANDRAALIAEARRRGLDVE
jgi:hypothetical protein